MNKIRTLLAILLLAPVFGMAQTSTENYVKTETMLDATGTSSIKSVQYYNGLGYPTVGVATVGGDGQTAYTLTTYDGMGRESCKYVPVATDNSILYKSPETVISKHSDPYSYSKTQYDAMDRPVSVTTAGSAFASRPATVEYAANAANDVIRYGVGSNNQLTQNGYYPANSLTKETSTDPDKKKVETFKDFQGKVILQRVSGNLCTYYVYDELDQLRFVLPPAYQDNRNKALYAYEYRYDGRGRLIYKQLPGAEFVEYWYDKADRMICMQDGVMRKERKYRFTIYDQFGRVAIQGLCSGISYTHDTSLLATARYDQSEVGFLNSGYKLQDTNVEDALTSPTLEAVNYYDSHDFMLKDRSSWFNGLLVYPVAKQTGQLTGSAVLAGNGEWISQVMEYDIRGNLLNTKSREIGGRIVTRENTYTFTNKLKTSSSTVNVGYGSTMTLAETYEYNKQNGQKSSCMFSVAHGKTAVSSTSLYAYNALGQLQAVTRPFTGSVTKTVNYDYDLHGWLKGITTNSFTEELFYADGPGTGLYNGNISAIRWKNGNYSNKRGYKFTYDGANRLAEAVYGEQDALATNTNRYSEKVSEYDKNGNIKRLERRGKMQNGSYGVIDNLSITYNGNQLSSVTESAAELMYNGSLDYKGAKGSQYKYNENGSLVSDKSRGIAFISYDLNNNPKQIYFTNGNVTKYVYNASGQKLRVIHYTAVPNISRTLGVKPAELTPAQILSTATADYMLGGSLVLKNGKIDKVLFDGGYAQATASGAADDFAFNYYNTDHLGNVREVVDASGTVQQVTNYYPFGATYFDDSAVKSSDYQPYKFNGKELDKMYGLNTYDYGARQYNPVTGRWDRIDPLCEKYYSISPYAYCGNSPIKNIDPDGREVRDGTGAYCEDNKDLKALAKSLAAHNDPNSIMIVAHGVYDKESDLYAYSIDIQTYNTKSGEWDHNYISNGKQLDKFLSANSKTWKDYKDGKISADDLHIVFYACGSSPVVQEISKDDAFKDVTLIAPNKRVHCLTYVNGRKDTTIENTKFEKTPKGTYRPVGNERDWGEWLTCKNGFIPSSYKGNKNLLPGTKGFAYR